MVTQETNTKLLGVFIEESQKWNSHVSQLVKALNSRLFQIRRIKNQIPKGCIMKIVQSLWFSKLRYGLQLCAKTRLSSEESQNCRMKELQCAENRLLRLLEGCRIKDRKSTCSLLLKHNLPSVNQLACEVKLLEAWKSLNIPRYPVSINAVTKPDPERVLRHSGVKTLEENCRTKIGANSFHFSTAKLWNHASPMVKAAKSISCAKKAIKLFCKSLPI